MFQVCRDIFVQDLPSKLEGEIYLPRFLRIRYTDADVVSLMRQDPPTSMECYWKGPLSLDWVKFGGTGTCALTLSVLNIIDKAFRKSMNIISIICCKFRLLICDHLW